MAGIAIYIPTKLKTHPTFFASVKSHEEWINRTMDYLLHKSRVSTATVASSSNHNVITISD